MNDSVSSHPAEAALLAQTTPNTIKRVKKIQLMVFDVDGVLTDGQLYYGAQGEVMKVFHALDGHGLRLLKEGGIHVALVTGRQGDIVSRRGAELGIQHVKQGIRNKVEALESLANQLQLDMSQIGFMGDDLIDLSAMQMAGFAASVPNAPCYVAQAAHWVAKRPGGAGAARECCDLILAAQGKLSQFFQPNPMIMSGAVQ